MTSTQAALDPQPLDLQHFRLTPTPRVPLLSAHAFLSYLILFFYLVINSYHSPNSKYFVDTNGTRSLALSLERVPKNFEQFQTCDFAQKFEKLAQIFGQAAVLKKISFFCGQNLPVRKNILFYVK